MFKFLLLGATCLLMTWSIYAQTESYYWADNARMSLTPSTTHFIVTADDAATLTGIKPDNVKQYESWAHKPYAVVESASSLTSYELLVELGFDTDEVQISPGYALSDGFIIYPTRTLVAKLIDKDDKAAMLHMAKCFGMKNITKKFGIYRIELENVNQILVAANTLQESGLFHFAQPDFYAPIERCQISDPLFSEQFQMNNTGQTIDGVPGANDADCNALEAWGITLGSSNTTVAVIDDGLEDHEDFNNSFGQSRYTAGFSPANNGNGDVIGDVAHGVSCAGSITASHNDIGVRGIAPLANMISVNIFVGGETTQDNADGITWAKNEGADVMNNSWVYPSCVVNFSNVNDAIADANTNGRGGLGCVIVFGSGNKFKSCVDYPGNHPDVIAVGAIDNTGVRSPYSNYGPALDIMAPSSGSGARVRTTDRMGAAGYNTTNYNANFGGTSAACPVVSGVATLLLGYDASLTSDEVKNILYSTATDMGPAGNDNEYANGRVDAFAALLAAPGSGPTCSDGIQNGQETSVDCGGPDCAGCLTYCASQGNNATYEWIHRFQFGNIDHTSDNNNGYGDFTYLSTGLTAGGSETVTLVPGFINTSSFLEYWRIWIDYNQDGDFDDSGELLFENNGSNSNTLSSTLNISSSALPGTTRLRVSMKYGGYPTSCESFDYGEVEDYTVTIGDGPTCTDGIQNGLETGVDCGGPACPSCLTYCASQGTTTNYEWIQGFQFGSIDNTSGDNNGYGDFTNLSTSLMAGGSVSLTIVPGFTSSVHTEYWRIWIDYNQDGDFDDNGELLVEAHSNETLSGILNISSSALPGTTRLRVSMKQGGYPTSCESFTFGEVEDYTVTIGSSLAGGGPTAYKQQSPGLSLDNSQNAYRPALQLYPNPAQEYLNLDFSSRTKGVASIEIINLMGQQMKRVSQQVFEGNNACRLNIDDLPVGTYMVRLNLGEEQYIEKLIIAR